ncbi:MAG: threonine/serine dehydratase [Planctomycetota bacterium]
MTSAAMPVTFESVRAAAARIAGRVHRTQVVTSATVDAELSAQVFWKPENLQKCGAFKARGAMNAVMALSPESAARGVITHSSGNHGAALAFAARSRGIPCTVVMPKTAPEVKILAVRGYGAEVVLCDAKDRDAVCAREQSARGASMVHPFEDPFVIAGQGTAAMELLTDVDDLDVVIVPVGGGGLCAGTAITVAAMRPSCVVIGAEPFAVDDAARSMQTRTRQPRVENACTWADGLMTGLGAPNFEILLDRGVRVVNVTEEAMLSAARFFVERMKIVVEPSSATVLAALRAIAPELRGKRIGAILSGGNTDFRWLAPLGPGVS